MDHGGWGWAIEGQTAVAHLRRALPAKDISNGFTYAGYDRLMQMH